LFVKRLVGYLLAASRAACLAPARLMSAATHFMVLETHRARLFRTVQDVIREN
jgi:hypothetical protein